jgi:periplasmic protein TonB
MKHIFRLRHVVPGALGVIVAALLAACSSPTQAPAPVTSTTPAPVSKAPGAAQAAATGSVARTSNAGNARAYREDAANHLYVLNRERIYKGRMPPLLYAVGVLQVDVDSRGGVRDLHWMRAPKHAPEVVAEIERTVRAAAPFPAPARMGKVTYTDTWLWHKSGRFQLDTLTEGQD